MSDVNFGSLSASRYPSYVASQCVPTFLITGSHDSKPDAQATKSAMVGAEILPNIVLPDSKTPSGQTQTPQLKKRLRSSRTEPHVAMIGRKLSFPDPRTETHSEQKTDSFDEVMKTIPFHLLTTSSVLQNQVVALDEFVRKTLLGILHSSLIGHGIVKCTPENSIVPGLCIKCRREERGDSVEIYVRHLVQIGGVKEVYRQIYLHGSKRGQVYAYAKPRKDSVQRGQNQWLRSEMRHEIRMSCSLPSSPGLIQMKEVMHRKDPTLLKGLIMPWCEKGDLNAYLQKNRPNGRLCLSLARKIAEGLRVIHANKKCHVDLKSGNILLQENGQPLIGDFGRMRDQGTAIRFPISTYSCLAPEQIAENFPIDPSADMWGFGLILLELVHGIQANLYIALISKMQQADFKTSAKFPKLKAAWIDTRQKIIAQLQDQFSIDQLIKRLLSENPKLRPTAQEVIVELDAIQDQFLVQTNSLLKSVYAKPV